MVFPYKPSILGYHLIRKHPNGSGRCHHLITYSQSLIFRFAARAISSSAAWGSHITSDNRSSPSKQKCWKTDFIIWKWPASKIIFHFSFCHFISRRGLKSSVADTSSHSPVFPSNWNKTKTCDKRSSTPRVEKTLVYIYIVQYKVVLSQITDKKSEKNWMYPKLDRQTYLG